MKKYILEMSEIAEQDLENIISYLRYNLSLKFAKNKHLCYNIGGYCKRAK